MNIHCVAHCDLLGGFRLFDQTETEFRFPVVKGAAIIAFLSSKPDGQASRGELTGLLWGDKPEATARTNLRQCLHQMRSRLSGFEPNFLTFSSHSVNLDRTKLSLDIDMLVDAGRIMDLAYPGEVRSDHFLFGFEDLDPAFSEWLLAERTKLGERFKNTLKSILNDRNSDYQHQLRAAQHLNVLDPSLEISARFLIEKAAAENDLSSLLQVYQKHWDVLGEEWAEEPSGRLQKFVGETRVRLGDATSIKPTTLIARPIRRYVTVLALTIRQSNENPPPKESALKQVKEAIAALDGTVVDSNPRTLCAVFGLGGTTENSARDAVEVSLLLQAQFRDQNLRVGIGIDTGYVLAKPATSATQKPEISGSVVGHAEMLANAGGEQSISSTMRTLYGIENFYQLRPDGDHFLGVSDVVHLLGRSSVLNSHPSKNHRGSFLGRAPFLAALWEVWSDALNSGSLQIASIQGPAGIGKTRLADEFIRRLAAESICVARAVCNRYDRSSPLEPLHELLNSLPATTGASHPENNPPEKTDRALSMDAIIQQLTTALRAGPAAIFIDDWQYADDATRLAISRLMNSEARTSLLLVLTSRNVPADEWLVTHSHQFVLSSFTEKEVVERAEIMLNRPIDDALRQQIVAKSGGNPLFLDEICHALNASRSDLTHDAVILDLPTNLQSLFASRLERLSEEEVETLFAIAVHGDQVEHLFLTKVLGRTVAPATLERLSQLDILAASSKVSIRFKHSLVRDVIYNMIPEDIQQSLHRTYAEILKAAANTKENDQFVEKLAFHYRSSGQLAEASYFSELSGDKALKASALDRAMRHYGLALDLTEQLPMHEDVRKRWISLTLRWAIPTTYAPSHEQLPTLEKAEVIAKQTGDLPSASALRYWIGYFAYVLGEKHEALQSFQAAKTIADTIGDARQSVEITGIVGCLLASVGRYDEAETAMRKAIEIKNRFRKRRDRAPVTSVYLRANLALVRADRGHFDEAQNLIDDALSRVRGFEHEVESSILLFSGTINIWRGDWKTALENAEKSRERSEKVSSPYLMGMSRCIWGYAHWKLHRNTRGLDTLVRNARWMRDRGLEMYYSFVCGWLADTLADAGRQDGVRAAYFDAQRRAALNEIAGMAMACRATALIAVTDADFERARACLVEADTIAARRGAKHEFAANRLVRARLLNAQKKNDEAIGEVRAAKEEYRQLGLEHRYRMACDVEVTISAASHVGEFGG